MRICSCVLSCGGRTPSQMHVRVHDGKRLRDVWKDVWMHGCMQACMRTRLHAKQTFAFGKKTYMPSPGLITYIKSIALLGICPTIPPAASVGRTCQHMVDSTPSAEYFPHFLQHINLQNQHPNLPGFWQPDLQLQGGMVFIFRVFVRMASLCCQWPTVSVHKCNDKHPCACKT